MARLIPAWIETGDSPPGEIVLFEAFKYEPDTDDWTVLHSIDIPAHVRQVHGEADFLILAPSLGVLCLEVKSHQSVSRGDDGLWRMGGDAPTPRSPFRQASDAMYSIIKRIKQASDSLTAIPFVSAVCFPRCNFDVQAAEWEPWQVIDERLLQARPLRSTLVSIFERARQRYESTPTARWFRDADGYPTEGQCEAILRIVRPSFEVNRSPKARRNEREAELRHYTEEQFFALDGLESNPRVLIEGAAGTGKTLLAVEAARRAHLAGTSTLLACYNRMLGHWLQSEAKPLAPAVVAGTFHSLMLSISGLRPPPEADDGFWSEELPAAAADALLAGHDLCGGFELAILDEAQDLARPQFLDVLDLLLDGGLDAGRLMAFGDFERQAIYGCGDEPATTLIERVPGLFRFSLLVNCRNRPRIGALVSRLSGLDAVYKHFRRADDGVEPDFFFYSSAEEQQTLLTRQLEALKSEGFALSDVTVLSTRADSSAASQLNEPWRSRVRAAGDASTHHARYCTAHAFKGLESPAIVVTDLDSVTTEAAQALLYVAMTRPTDRLVILASEDAKGQLWDLFWKPQGGSGQR